MSWAEPTRPTKQISVRNESERAEKVRVTHWVACSNHVASHGEPECGHFGGEDPADRFTRQPRKSLTCEAQILTQEEWRSL